VNRKTCGGGLARDGAMSVDERVGGEIAFASKLAPTVLLQCSTDHLPEKNLNTQQRNKQHFQTVKSPT
jgi:hypothetical protein